MNKFVSTVFSLIGFVAVAVVVLSSFHGEDDTNGNPITTSLAPQSTESMTNSGVQDYDLPQQVKAIPSPNSPNFAGEIVPINPDTKERLDRELTVNAYWQSSTLLNIKMANRFFPIMEGILAQNGVPDDFKYLAVAESNLRNVKSGANAKGFWQFRDLAAKELGLEVNTEVDERYHIEKSTQAACDYLLKLKKRFGTWTDAAAAYNVGPTNYAKTMSSQGHNSFYDLSLNEETDRYVFRLIAIKEILKNPQAFGFYVDPSEYYEQDNVYQIEVTQSVPDWGKFARENGTTYRLLKYYNPWLRDTKLTVTKKKYIVKLPRNR